MSTFLVGFIYGIIAAAIFAGICGFVRDAWRELRGNFWAWVLFMATQRLKAGKYQRRGAWITLNRDQEGAASE